MVTPRLNAPRGMLAVKYGGIKADVVWPIADMEYGTREFGIRDPDGYVLAFAEQRGNRSA